MAYGGGLNSGRRSVSLAALAALLAASPASPSGETVVRTLGTLPPGKTVVVRFSAIVNTPFPAGATQVSTQGTVTGSNFSSVLTDDPDAPGTADPTVTPINAAPDLAIAKTDGVSTAVGGQTLVYNLGITNIGNQAAANV